MLSTSSKISEISGDRSVVLHSRPKLYPESHVPDSVLRCEQVDSAYRLQVVV